MSDKYLIPLFILFLILLTISFIAGYNYGKEKIIISRIDTVYTIKFDKIHIYDTITKKIKVIVPDDINIEKVQTMRASIDSLQQELHRLNVKELAILDTIYGDYKDTISVKYDTFLKYWDLYIGIAPRSITLQKELIYLPPPKREWWDNPYIGMGLGIIVGGVGTYLLINNK